MKLVDMDIKLKKEYLLVLVLLIVLSIYVFFQDPAKGPILPCIILITTGYYCPGCGMTRAVNSLMHLEFYKAFRYNALIFILPVLFLIHLFKHKEFKNKDIMLILMVIISVGYGLARNLEYFSYLRPLNIK